MLILARAGCADVVETLNSIRAEGCDQRRMQIPPLQAVQMLDEVAKNLADGSDLSSATSDAGYRAEIVTSIYLRSPLEDALKDLIARRFCDTVIDPELTDAGVFQQGDQTWIVLARSRTAPGVIDGKGAAGRVVALINEARRKPRMCGRGRHAEAGSLRQSDMLQSAAEVHARDMAANRSLSHEGSDGSRPADRVSRAGYSWSAVAENIAEGPATAEGAVAIWLASPGHCANLMSEAYSETGVAYAVDRDRDRVYWVQVFASPG